jgi:hypothetical protein
MRSEHAQLRLAAGVLVAAVAAIGALPAPHTRVGAFLLLYAVAFGAYLAAVRAAWRAPSAASRALIVGVCIAAHAAVVPARPDLSSDIYRYAWEGRLILDGHNPFSAPPEDSALVGLRDADYARISHQRLPTIYPPLAQGAFALAALVHPGPRVIKVIFSLFNLATVLVLFGWLRRRGRPEAHALLFAWSPLVIVETGHSGHVDAMAAFLLVLALALWDAGRRAWAAFALGASALVKYVAVASVPWLARRRHVALVVLMSAVVAAGYAPFFDAGAKLLSSLRQYSTNWWFNGPPFLALSGFLGDGVVARRLLAAAGIAFALAAAHRERDLARYTFLVLGCALIVSPTVYPWYLIWIVPLLCAFPNRAWIGFTGLVMLSYGVWDVYNASGVWFIPTWMLAVEYVPFYLLLLAGLWRDQRRAWAPA